MKKWIGSLLALYSFAAISADFPKVSENFEQSKDGQPISGWKSGFGGDRGSPRWKVTQDPSAPSRPNVLRQSGSAPHNWLVKENTKILDGTIGASFKIESGKEDPEAGVIWRFVDPDNYYYVRANILENNVILYRRYQGRKEEIKTVDVPVATGKWHRFDVEFHQDKIEVKFNGKTLLHAVDANITKPGAVGLFTMADTVADFDDFRAASK